MSKKTTKINKNGQVEISGGDSDEPSSSSFSSFHHHNLDVFGFNLDIRQFCIVLAVCSLMLGTQGTLALLIALGAYTLFMRVISRNGNNNNRSSSSSSWRPGGGGGGGPRIRRISDLPCDPKVG